MAEIPKFQDLIIPQKMKVKIDQIKGIIDKAQPDWSARILVSLVDERKRIVHSAIVGYGCQEIAKIINGRSEVTVDEELIFHSGMLHDVGQYGQTLGRTPWHELKGAVILKSLGLDKEAEIVSRHATPIEGLTTEGKNAPSWLTLPQTIEDKILTIVDFLVLQGGKVVSLNERLADIYQRFPLDGENPAGRITKSAEGRLRDLFEEINGLTDNRLLDILNKVHQREIKNIEAKIPEDKK